MNTRNAIAATIILTSSLSFSLSACSERFNETHQCDDLCRSALAGFLINQGGFASSIHPYLVPQPPAPAVPDIPFPSIAAPPIPQVATP